MKSRTLMVAGVLVLAAARLAIAEPLTYRLEVDGLECPRCLGEVRELGAFGIEKEFAKIAGVEEIAVDTATGVVVVTVADGSVLDMGAIAAAVAAAEDAVNEAIRVRYSVRRLDRVDN